MMISLNDADAAEEEHREWFLLRPMKSRLTRIDTLFTHVTFDPCLRVIPKSALEEHPFLQRVKLPKTVKKIDKGAFRNCKHLSNVDFQDGGCFLQTIGKRAFSDCPALENLAIPDSVMVIGAGAFQRCDALNRVQLPRRLKVLLPSTFLGCISLVEMNIPDGLSRIEDNTFSGCTSLRNVKIPHTVKVIGESAFGRCRRLTFVELPKGLKKICRRTFEYCDNLSGIVLPGCLEEIEYHAFRNCTSLQGVEFPKDTEHLKIDPSAFFWCYALVNVSIPATVVSVKRTSICACMSFSESVEPFSGGNPLLRDRDGNQRIRDRFAKLPIHSLCYHSSVTTSDELKQALDACSEFDSTKHKDYLGMTPFHIVATSVNPRVDVLECLLSKYPVAMLAEKDIHGYTMMDYLLKNTRGMRMLQMVLRIVFSEWLLKEAATPLPPPQTHKEGELVPPGDVAMKWNLNNQIESLVECTDTRSKRERVREIFESVGFHMRTELTGLLDLATWKRRMVEVLQNETRSSTREFSTIMDRESCRYQCGAEVVIENVTEYLWANEESKYCTALSVFPFCTLENNDILDFFLFGLHSPISHIL